MADGRRLRRLQIRVVGRERGLRRPSVSSKPRRLLDERVVELADAVARGKSQRNPERLAPGTARAQPSRCGAADATLELGLAGIERIAKRRIPRELLPRDRLQLEQPA